MEINGWLRPHREYVSPSSPSRWPQVTIRRLSSWLSRSKMMPLSLCTCIEPKKKPKVIWSSEGLEQETVIWLALLCHCPPSHKSLKSLGQHALLIFITPVQCPAWKWHKCFMALLIFKSRGRKGRRSNRKQNKQVRNIVIILAVVVTSILPERQLCELPSFWGTAPLVR